MKKDYIQDVFYGLSHLSIKELKELFKEAKDLSKFWQVDILKSFYRESTDMSFENILKKLDKNSHIVFIHRKGWIDENGNPKRYRGWEIETGFRSWDKENKYDYFLFIFLDEKNLDHFIEKYKLRELKPIKL